jgi:valyl-tRNA synthetase
MGLVVGNTPGTDLNLDPQKVGAYQKFANKLWNIARFVLENTEDFPQSLNIDDALKVDVKDVHWIPFAHLVKDVTEDLESYRFHLASEKLYHYLWHTFADEVIEECKEILKGEDEDAKKRVKHNLYTILHHSLKLLHPFMPFVTEEIWSHLPVRDSKMLMVAEWPK